MESDGDLQYLGSTCSTPKAKEHFKAMAAIFLTIFWQKHITGYASVFGECRSSRAIHWARVRNLFVGLLKFRDFP